MSENRGSSGVGFTGILQVAFIVLKLTKVISWSWLWVLAPTWIMALFWVVLLIVLWVKNWRGS